jgi:hypothetical protein
MRISRVPVRIERGLDDRGQTLGRAWSRVSMMFWLRRMQLAQIRMPGPGDHGAVGSVQP